MATFTLTLYIVGTGSVKIGTTTTTTIYTNSTNIITGLSGVRAVEAIQTDETFAFARWSNANTTNKSTINLNMNVNRILTAHFAEAPVVTRRVYWPSQTELTDNSKSCRCGCFKPASSYASFAERDRAIRFCAAGCNCQPN